MLRLALHLAFLPLVVLSLSSADIVAVFPSSSSALTGSKVALPHFDLTVITNSTHALVSLNQTRTPPESAGWMGSGVGTAMVNADFLIAWATTTGSAVTWTLSHRNSPGEQEPVLAASNTELSSNRFFTLVPSLSTSTASSPYTVVTYLRLLRQPSNYPSTSPFKTIARRQTPFIFASCSVNPRNAAEGAHLQQHDQDHGPTSLDLSQPVSLSASNNGSSYSPINASTQQGTTTRDKLLTAHAILATLVYFLFIPVAIVLARFKLQQFRWIWYHIGLQVLSGVLLIVLFVLGASQSRDVTGSHIHAVFGAISAGLFLAQFIFGILAKLRPLPTLHRKHPLRLAHILFFSLPIAAGWTTIRLGIPLYGQASDSGFIIPKGVVTLYWVMVGVWTLAYLLGWVREAIIGSRGPK